MDFFFFEIFQQQGLEPSVREKHVRSFLGCAHIYFIGFFFFILWPKDECMKLYFEYFVVIVWVTFV